MKILKEKDIRAVEEAINLIWNEEVRKIFASGQIEKIEVALFDSEKVYLFSKREGIRSFKKVRKSVLDYNIYKYKHKGKIGDKCYGMGGGNPLQGFDKILKNRNFFFIPPMTEFIKIQKRNKNKNPWQTKEGYIYTIIHEFGHEYFSMHSNIKEKSRGLIKRALESYKGRKKEIKRLPLRPHSLHELFAALTEIYTAKTFKSKYYKDLKKFMQKKLKKILKSKNGPEECFDDEHKYAYSLALLYINKYIDWYKKLLKEF